jgi:tetratricopeptide (TPR) repeat protein
MTKIVFVGNCQADSLFRAYARWIAPERGETVHYVAAYAEADSAAREQIRRADIIALQITDSAQTVNLADLETNARIVMFPHVTAAFLWPFHGGTHPRNADIPQDYSKIFTGEFSDRWLNKRIARGDDPQTILARYRDPDVLTEAGLDRLVELVVMHQQQRDAVCDMRLGDRIMANLASERVFAHMHHPSLQLFAFMLCEVFSRMGCSSEQIERSLSHYRTTPFPPGDMPIHPRIAEHLGLKWACHDLRYQIPPFGEHVTWDQYCQRYVSHDWNEPLQRCLAVAKQNLPRAELETVASELETASARYEASEGYCTLSDIRRRLDDLTGSLEAIRRAISLDPFAWHYATRLARLLILTGQREEGLAAAKYVAAWNPEVAEVRIVLLETYAKLGSRQEALQEARAALAIVPDHPYVLHRLADLEGRAD